jgi:hypothetical protein
MAFTGFTDWQSGKLVSSYILSASLGVQEANTADV